jgi:hypothetical protein
MMSITNAQPMTNNAVLKAEGGLLVVGSAVTGAGSGLVSGGGLLKFKASFNQNVLFQGASGGTLALSQSFSGTISGFNLGDAVDLTAISDAAGERMVLQSTLNGVETFALEDSGDNVLRQIKFAGNLAASDFTINSDGASHAQIGYYPRTARSQDFNADAHSDILFRDPAGALATWQINDTTISGGGGLGNPGAGWTFEGTGDFNSDRHSDILLQNASGSVAIREMNAIAVIGGGAVGAPGGTFAVVGIGDFNGDGASDIVFRDAQNNS